ncbi:MAG: V-type ATP synthase subunit F [Candidatus Altiarchaeota archaeon]|nr:V-type ATP synthase subunit F [Candidatus Altiarchaeota archaeon]
MAKLCIIGDRLTVTGLELAGLKNMQIADQKTIVEKIRDMDEDMDVILVTQSLAREAVKEIKELRRDGKIVVEIPDREGGGEETTSMIVRNVIGFDLAR